MARFNGYFDGPAPSYTLEDVPPSEASFLPPEPVAPSYTLEDVTQGPTEGAIAKMAKRSSEMRLDSPIPTVRASPTSDVTGPVAMALPATTPERPAGPADTGGKPSLPAPEAGAGGDADEERNLYLARLIARNAASFGAMGAGKSIDTGAVEALGERLKQVQALRAKREEQGLEQQRERATWGASNRATLASFMAQYKDRPEVVEALKAQEPGADTTKPSDFLKNIVGSLTTPPKVASIAADVPVKKARAGQAEAGRDLALAKAGDVPTAAQSRDALRRSQIDLNRARIEHMNARKEADVGPASTTGPLSDPRLEQRRQDNFSKVTRGAQKLYTDPLIDLASLEKAAGTLLAGETPSWWDVPTLTKINSGVYVGLPPDATKFAKTYFPVINALRHALYGSALSAGEQKAFADQIELGLKQGPKALAASIQALSNAAKDKTRMQLGYDFDRNPDLATQWLDASGFSEKVKGTSLEDTFAKYAKKPAAGGAAAPKRKPQPANTTAMRDEGGALKYVPNDQVQAAEAAGWKRE